MTDFTVPCDTFARLSNVLRSMPPDIDPHFKSIRIDNGVAVASNRIIMAVENIGKNPGIIHVIASPGLIENCRKEAAYSSTLTITVNEPLKWAVAKTSFGYIEPGNCCLWSDAANDLDKWRDIALSAKEPVKVNQGGMFWDAENIANLAAASPSGRVVFEENIDTHGRVALIRDINDYDWFGMFQPWGSFGEKINPAVLPTWMVPL